LSYEFYLIINPLKLKKMARQKGVIKYVGTLGDIRHFKIKGQEGYFAGMVGGPTGDQVLSAPEFERTRENMNEFGASAKAGEIGSYWFISSDETNGGQSSNRKINFYYEENQFGRPN
jgi:hypothetical protein